MNSTVAKKDFNSEYIDVTRGALIANPWLYSDRKALTYLDLLYVTIPPISNIQRS